MKWSLFGSLQATDFDSFIYERSSALSSDVVSMWVWSPNELQLLYIFLWLKYDNYVKGQRCESTLFNWKKCSGTQNVFTLLKQVHSLIITDKKSIIMDGQVKEARGQQLRTLDLHPMDEDIGPRILD